MWLGHVARPWPSLPRKMARPSTGRATKWQGTPFIVPRQHLSTVFIDFLTSLHHQPTSKPYPNTTLVRSSKIAPQRFKNRGDPTSVLQEKLRKPKDTHTKSQI